MERSYFTKEAAELLGVQPVTIRSWSLLFEGAGYTFAKDGRGSRAFLERDITMFRRYIDLTQAAGIPQSTAIQTLIHEARGGTPQSTDVTPVDQPISETTSNAMTTPQRYEALVGEFRDTIDAVLQSNRVLLQHIDHQAEIIERMDRREARLIELLSGSREVAATRSNDGFWERVHGMFRR